MRPSLPVLISSSGVRAGGAFGLLRAIRISTASEATQSRAATNVGEIASSPSPRNDGELARRPDRLVMAERHGRPRPIGLRLRQLQGRRQMAELARRGLGLARPVLDLGRREL